MTSLANGPSMPSTEVAVDNLRGLGHDVTLDDTTIPDDLMYLAGWCGRPPGTVDPELVDRASDTERGRTILASEPAQPPLAEVRSDYGESLTDEDLLLRLHIPGPDVDAMYAAAKSSSPSFR